MDNTEFNSIKPSWNCKPLIRTPYKLLIFSLFASIFDTSHLLVSEKAYFVKWIKPRLDFNLMLVPKSVRACDSEVLSEPQLNEILVSGNDTGSASFDTVKCLTVLPNITLPIRIQIDQKIEKSHPE